MLGEPPCLVVMRAQLDKGSKNKAESMVRTLSDNNWSSKNPSHQTCGAHKMLQEVTDDHRVVHITIISSKLVEA